VNNFLLMSLMQGGPMPGPGAPGTPIMSSPQGDNAVCLLLGF